MKEMEVRNSSNALRLGLNDRCCVLLGEPGLLQSAGIESHSRSLGLKGMPNLALDYVFQCICSQIYLKTARILFIMENTFYYS